MRRGWLPTNYFLTHLEVTTSGALSRSRTAPCLNGAPFRCRRPTYTITCDEDGEQREVMDVHLERLKEPRSPLMPATSPPSIAAVSPSLDGDASASPAAPPSPPPPPGPGLPPGPQAPFAASRPHPTPGAVPFFFYSSAEPDPRTLKKLNQGGVVKDCESQPANQS